MSIDRDALLAALIVRALGPGPVRTGDVFLRSIVRGPLKRAIDAGFLERTELKVTSRGKTTRAPAVQLTESGRAALEQHAARADVAVAESLRIEALHESLQRHVSAMGQIVAEGTLSAQSTDDEPSNISGTSVADTNDLSQRVRNAYRKLTHYSEFRDGIVDIPRIYEELRRHDASFGLKTLHTELQRLHAASKLELRVCNDPRDAPLPDEGIWQDGTLLYYVYWREALA